MTTDPSAAEALARRFFPVWVKANQGHQNPLGRSNFQEITVGTCDLAELTYLRELRQAVIEAGIIDIAERPAGNPK